MKIVCRLPLPAASICLLLLLAACGAKGPLFLPEEPAHSEEVDADAEALPMPAEGAIDGQASDGDADARSDAGDDASLPSLDSPPAPIDESGDD